ncbi:hypothetical protein ACFCWY_09165 [Streptomyces sp. NPDC056362]|uniref:hypothetical protein n=1 Tax=unclassified Streptomyces TaxID=2593676 RepID=UPI0035DBDE60
MTTTAPARKLSDRAHRILFAVSLHPQGAWVETSAICTVLELTSHEVRHALRELKMAGRIERDRRPGLQQDGRKTYRTYFRLTDHIDNEAAA